MSTETLALTDEEKRVLFNYHKSKALYWADCESTQRRLAKKADPNTTDIFTGPSEGLCEGLRQTPENWLIRADAFRALKRERWRRANVFVAKEAK